MTLPVEADFAIIKVGDGAGPEVFTIACGIEVHVVGKDTVLMEADVEVDGDLQERNCTIIFRRRGKKVAVALIHRDLEGLHAELELERMADRHGDRTGPSAPARLRSEEHTSELQYLMRLSYTSFWLNNNDT